MLAIPRPPKVLVLTTFDRNEYVWNGLGLTETGLLDLSVSESS